MTTLSLRWWILTLLLLGSCWLDCSFSLTHRHRRHTLTLWSRKRKTSTALYPSTSKLIPESASIRIDDITNSCQSKQAALIFFRCQQQPNRAGPGPLKSEIPTGPLSGRDTFGAFLARRWVSNSHFSFTSHSSAHAHTTTAQFLRFSLSTTPQHHRLLVLLLDSTFSRLREEKFSFTRPTELLENALFRDRSNVVLRCSSFRNSTGNRDPWRE